MTLEQLKDYRKNALEIAHIESRLDELEIIYYPRAQNLDGQPKGGGGKDVLLSIIEKKTALENLLRLHQLELLMQQTEIEKAVEMLKDPTERVIIRLRYMGGLSWREIANETRYSEPQAKRKHKKALSIICKHDTP